MFLCLLRPATALCLAFGVVGYCRVLLLVADYDGFLLVRVVACCYCGVVECGFINCVLVLLLATAAIGLISWSSCVTAVVRLQ